jgi:4-hydroxy-3-methylbut-2-enyl diphosphate reductase
MLGDIVHNEKVVSELSQLGVEVVKNLDQIDPSVPILFRSHGTPANIWTDARHRGLTIIDATCPLVRQIHNEAQMLAAEGRQLIIIGDKNHEEVEGIASQVDNPIIVSTPQEAEDLPLLKKVGVVAQSTQMMENVSAIVSVLATKVADLRFINTICRPTRQRQQQIRELALNNDVMLVVGSKNSANTRRLAEIARKLNAETHHIEDAGQVDSTWFKDKISVGIAAGASTPVEVVEEVVKKITKFA